MNRCESEKVGLEPLWRIQSRDICSPRAILPFSPGCPTVCHHQSLVVAGGSHDSASGCLLCFVYALSPAVGQVWSWLLAVTPSYPQQYPDIPPLLQGSLGSEEHRCEGKGVPAMCKEASPYTCCAYTLAYSNTRMCTHAHIHRPARRHVLTHTMPWLGQRHLLHY